MNLGELSENIKHMVESYEKQNKDINDVSVLITTSEPSIGGRAFSHIRNIHMGFDWENNQVRIEPIKYLVKKGNTIKDIKEPYGKEYDGKVIYWCRNCQGVVSISDRYCKHCGQKLKK